MAEFLDRLRWVLSGAPDASSGNRLLLISLVACSLFAMGQWLTMLGTRWGDHHAMAKSFVLSVLVHLCLGLGWATILDEFPPPPPAFASESEQSVPIRAVLNPSEEALSQPDAGNTPIWQQPLSIPAPQVARSDRDAAAVSEASPNFTRSQLTAMERETSPERQPSLAPVSATELLAVSTTATEPETTPQVTPAAATPTPAAPAETSAPPSEAVARAETGPVAAAPARQNMLRTASADVFVDTVSSRGSAQRTASQPDELEFSIPLPLDENPTVPRPLGAATDAISRKASPIATPTGEPQNGATSSAAAAESSRFARSSNSRTAASNSGSGTDRTESARSSLDVSRERLTSARESLGTPNEIEPQPSVIRPAPTGSRPAAAPTGAATTYRLRRIDGRREIALKNGGTEASEQAVEQALAWLARHQEAEGYWDADRHGGGQREVRNIDKDKPPGGTETDTGLTGLAILSYLGAGHTHEEGNYTEVVSRALRWLIARQRTDGYLGGKATYYDQMYCHAIATYALAEALGMQHDADEMPALREAVSKAIWYISQTQNADGGWRYRVGASDSDMSMFGWQLMAVKSAELAGIEVPEETRRGMIQFLRSRSRGADGGLAGYKEDSKVTAAMTAEALFCKQMYGLKRTSPSSREAAEYLQDNLPRLSQPDEYYWYYGTLAMYQYGGEPWQRWNQSLRDTLIRLQRKSGDAAGSWDPAGPWASVGGRVFSTTCCALSLEVYYRFLPLYQVGEE